MRQSRIKSFYLAIVDEDNKIFNIVGPIESDAVWNEKICALQDEGKRIRCFSFPITESLKSVIDSYSKQSGYSFSEKLICEISKNEFENCEYQGSLPEYAQAADRKRLVKILCKGKCRATCWAEMTINYPGRDILSKSQVGDFTAICLRCGCEAVDGYNWYR